MSGVQSLTIKLVQSVSGVFSSLICTIKQKGQNFVLTSLVAIPENRGICILIVLSLNLEVSLWVCADRAELRSLLAYYDVTTI